MTNREILNNKTKEWADKYVKNYINKSNEKLAKERVNKLLQWFDGDDKIWYAYDVDKELYSSKKEAIEVELRWLEEEEVEK